MVTTGRGRRARLAWGALARRTAAADGGECHCQCRKRPDAGATNGERRTPERRTTEHRTPGPRTQQPPCPVPNSRRRAARRAPGQPFTGREDRRAHCHLTVGRRNRRRGEGTTPNDAHPSRPNATGSEGRNLSASPLRSAMTKRRCRGANGLARAVNGSRRADRRWSVLAEQFLVLLLLQVVDEADVLVGDLLHLVEARDARRLRRPGGP